MDLFGQTPLFTILQNDNLVRKDSCIGSSYGIKSMIALDELGCLGFANVFQHSLGYTIFKFDSVNRMLRVIDYSHIVGESNNLPFNINNFMHGFKFNTITPTI